MTINLIIFEVEVAASRQFMGTPQVTFSSLVRQMFAKEVDVTNRRTP